jgi:hypothetical protein
MTIRLIVDGRGAHRRDMIEYLIAKSNKRVELAFHLGDVKEDISGPDLNRMRPSRDGRDLLLGDFKLRGVDLPLITSPEFRQSLETAIDQLHRSDAAYRYRSHNLRNLQDYIDFYHIVAEAYAARIVQTEATHALFMNVPHVGYDTILYQVARAMGLKTIVLYQTLFPNRFFSMARVEDLGLIDLSGSEAPPMMIEKGSSQELFYMDERWQDIAPRGKISSKAVARFIKFMALRNPRKILDLGYMQRTLGRISKIYNDLPDWRDPFARFFHDNELAYFEHLAEYEQGEVDLAANFIYVPLQNQPELSTSALGGIWRDQLLMIEALARDLPIGWKIYVKENPRQTAFARGPLFFHRLKRIEGVQLLPSHANTHSLSANAKFTASVTSNACWESIRKGKAAIAFGAAWYRSLPGIVRWQPGLDFKAIAAMRFEHSDLERAAGAIISRSHIGILETVYTNIVPDYDSTINTERVAASLFDLLTGELPLTFPDTSETNT